MSGILIIEDNANIRKFAVVNLQARGYEVTAVDNAEDGLEHLRHEPPDILLLDLKLPGMSGLDLLMLISSQPETEHIPVIVMSASEGALEDLRNEDFPQVVDIMMKPVSASRLSVAVKDAFEH
jgi:CheY-like chemotaxis protein